MLKEGIYNYWNERAWSYSESGEEELKNFKKEAWKKLIQSKLNSETEVKALDLGTGSGFLAIIMSEMGYKVTAIDRSEEALEEARKNAELAAVEIDFIVRDAETLNFEDEFDLIINKDLSWLLSDPVNTYSSWDKALKEKGQLMIFDSNWYAGLRDEKFREKYLGDLDLPLGKPSKEGLEFEEIRKKLPLAYEDRPLWDVRTLFEYDFNKIEIEEDINELIYTEEEQLLHRDMPLFFVIANK